MKRSLNTTTSTKTCRFGSGSVTVSWSRDKVSSVTLSPWPGSGAASRPRSRGWLAQSLARVLDGGPIPRRLWVDVSRLSRFARRVLGRCAGIKPGRVMTYQELARAVSRPGSARAVGRVLSRNPFPLLIPCHRVVGKDMRLTGFRGGLAWKEFLLGREGWQVVGTGTSRRLTGKNRMERGPKG